MNEIQSLRNHPEVVRIFKQHSREICIRVDHGFSILMGIQWVVAILVAILFFPQTWLSRYYNVENSVIMATVMGAFVALPALLCIMVMPGQRFTRLIVAMSQMCFSILLIHLTGGRIETHFHVLLSLAFLAFYKDPLVLGVASFMAIADHALRGCFMPMSIYGDIAVTNYKFLEHSAWILFEDLVLVTGISYIREDLRDMAISKFELMQAREEAMRTSSVKSMFLSNMSHEIRTPLNSIMGFTEILSDTPLNQEQKTYLNTISRCSDSLMRILNDVLDLSKIENGLLQVDRHRFDVRKFHREVHEMFILQCKEKGIELEMHIHSDVPEFAVADSHRIRQVLVNLLANAVKFTAHGKVSIVVHHDVNSLATKWSVTDTGVGISPENQANLFKPFGQGDASVSRKFGGTGLGLVITKNLIELMDGKISLVSKAGEGTTFSFTLQLEKA